MNVLSIPPVHITDRIDRVLRSKDNVTRIPVHPDDFAEAQFYYKAGFWGAEPGWELTKLGETLRGESQEQ